MKKKTIILSVIISIAVVWAIKAYLSHSDAMKQPAVWVEASAVKESTLPQEANAIGTLVARSIEITPEVAGHVDNILFKDGTFVRQDAVLVQLDDAVYKAKADSSKARLVYSEADYNRKTLLGKRGAIAKQAIDQAEADFKEKKAEAQESDVMLNKMKLKAPFAGVVGKAKINRGDYVTTGQRLVTLTDTKHLRIEFNVPEKFLPALKLGQHVSITTATYPGKVFSGKLSFISPTIDTENRSVALYADVPNENNQLAAGMFVNVTQALDSMDKVILVPARSLVPVLDGEQIYKVVDGKAYAVPVVIGKRSEDSVQVMQGLKPGDVVITDGQHKVKNGMPVQIKS